VPKNKNQLAIQSLAFASQLLPAIIGVLSFMLLVRVTKPGVLGQYVVYMAAVVLFEMIKSGGLQSALVMRASTSDKEQQLRITGSAYWLGGIVSFSLSIILIALYFSGIFLKQPGIQVFCGWYACLGMVTLPLHIAEASAVARQDLKFLLYLRVAQSANALITAVFAYFYMGSLEAFATVHLVFTTVLLITVLLAGKTNPLHVKYKTIEDVKTLLNLIKYTLATLATTNLLKTADTLLIGSFMGPIEVARYAIPLKLTELFEIPLRSLSSTAFPQLAEKNNHKDFTGFKYSFVQYLSWCYMLYFPALIIAFIFAPYIVLALGGHQYADTTSIFRVFIIYGLFLPANRVTGISLDALNKPHKNFIKVLVMAIINIVGDLVAIHFSNNLDWVAFVSVLNGACGVIIGWWMLEQTGILARGNVFNQIFDYSNSFLRQRFNRFT
jgi:O-antigen/teichoic acid export membrane protein